MPAPLRRFLRYAACAAAIVGGLLAGDWLVAVTGVPLPRSVVGLFLLAALCFALPHAQAILEPLERGVARWLGALIVPPLVGAAMFAGLLGQHAAALAVILIGTTLLAGFVTAYLYRRMAAA
jgi:putative effector of murein hydrolase LrgA (UPF0299 family)